MIVRAAAAFVAIACVLGASSLPARSDAASDVLARVRARGLVRCAGVVRPGVAVPTVDGRWYGIAPDICRALAAAVLGNPERMAFRPYPDAARAAPAGDPDDVVFLSGAELVEQLADARATLALGPAIVHDGIGVMVHAAGAANVAALANGFVCVEPGSASDRALTRAFAQRGISLHEHPFQEPDEMRQAYETGNCDALAGPLTTLASVRADPKEGHASDRILPDILADDPIFAATPPDPRWSRVVWWTFSALVDAEDAGIDLETLGAEARAAIPGVPPAVGNDLGLPEGWERAALAASGTYGEIFDRDLGSGSRFRLGRGANALRRDGGLIYGLRAE